MKDLCPLSLLTEPNENFNVDLEITPEGFCTFAMFLLSLSVI